MASVEKSPDEGRARKRLAVYMSIVVSLTAGWTIFAYFVLVSATGVALATNCALFIAGWFAIASVALEASSRCVPYSAAKEEPKEAKETSEGV